MRLSLNDWLAEARLLNRVIVDYIDFELVLIYLLLAVEQSVIKTGERGFFILNRFVGCIVTF